MHIELMTGLALLAGGGAVPVQSDRPVSAPLIVPVRPAVSAHQGERQAVFPITLQLSQDCAALTVAAPQLYCNEEPTISLSQLRGLAAALGLRVEPQEDFGDSSKYTLQLELPQDGDGLRAVGFSATSTRDGEPHYSASTILDFIAQTSGTAVFTAKPRLTLRTDKAVLDMGKVPDAQLLALFAGLSYSMTEALIPAAFAVAADCTDACTSPGVAVQVWSEQESRVQTNLAEGEVVLLIMPGTADTPSGEDSFGTAVGLVQQGGWVTFPLEQLPDRWVTDPAKVQLAPENQGNGLLLRVTHTPLQNMSAGIVPLR